jgi:hypothetical protein
MMMMVLNLFRLRSVMFSVHTKATEIWNEKVLPIPNPPLG